MIIGKHNIDTYFKDQAKSHFAVYYRGKESTGNSIFKTEGEESDPERAYQDFTRCLALLGAGQYTLILNNKVKAAERGGNRVDFTIPVDEGLRAGATAIVGQHSIAGPSYSVEDMLAKATQMATEQFQRLKAEDEAKTLKEENIRLQKELKLATEKVEDPWNKLIAGLAPHAEPIIAGFLGPLITTGIAGVSKAGAPSIALDENATEEEINAHAQQVFETFVGALQQARPNDWLEILGKLTVIITENPKKFEMALNFL